MYCKMLNEAVKKKKGIEVDTQDDFDTSIELDVDAYIPGGYILNEEQKLDIYKRIASIETIADADDMRDELRDRFGDIPREAENLLKIALLKAKAHRLYIREIKGGKGEIVFEVLPTAKYKAQNIPTLIKAYKGKMSFKQAGKPAFIYKYKKDEREINAQNNLLEDTDKILTDIENSILKTK